ncbi:sugar transferase [Agriterribacter sp.]|uniref:sugar transferase n=1 Tax=Agriterribacter sp. TaxID=2821509 RepID=UPI002B5D9385|nr:sugar transferase [Agriterribacter sp.]HTN07273.1 sugar transferase [Agriterribacter sp.]
MDFAVASLLMILLLPVFLILIIVLWIHYRGNPFFLQQRVGYREKVFSIYKFKSMRDLYDDEGNRLPDHMRLTIVGKFLRKASLDELPQLINILKDNMSFIGPRPLPVRFLPYYTERERKRHFTKPGITGLAQVSGRNHLPWNERLELDVKYVENISFGTDFKIVYKTILKVVKQEDITLTPQIDSLIVQRGGKKPDIKKGTK